ncbi:MAG TPA: glycosyltransferase family 4 protein [Solirubrobacterales bacterium]|nr:glycosyltransferase family 4 protein [Solirubrobacterales bacterium]
MTDKPKILYVSHNHPTIRPGGAEAYAYELYRAVRDGGEFEPLFLARTGPPVSISSRYHEGTLLTGVNEDPNQYFFYTDTLEYDWLNGTPRGKTALIKYLREFLQAQRPDVVHLQHTLFFGYDMLREMRNTLGDEVPILYTLHEFLPICHRNGQLVRTTTEKPCREESPRRCHECFPEVSPQEFFMRKRFIQSHMSLVDRFIAPSSFLRDRYVDWGLPADKVFTEEYGRLPVTPAETRDRRKRNRLVFIGQLSYFKGVNVLLEAMKRLQDDEVDVHLSVYGANLELQPDEFRSEFAELLEATKETVDFEGEFNHDDLPTIMADADWVVVPSVWWENSPLVIQEAGQHRRPVIASDIGGMAEKVHDGVSGLHFRAADPASLAETISKAIGTRKLWDELQARIEPPYEMDEHVRSLTRHYKELLASRSEEELVTPPAPATEIESVRYA